MTHFAVFSSRTDALQTLEAMAMGMEFPNFFPTPAPVRSHLIGAARLSPGMLVLEPSAGKGCLAQALRAAGAKVHCVEVVDLLRQILLLKGFEVVASDVLSYRRQYPRIVANPPFDRAISHLRHYHSLLVPGGRLVSVAPDSIFVRSHPICDEFRCWFRSVGGEVQMLPEHSFLRSARPTLVKTRMIVIDKK